MKAVILAGGLGTRISEETHLKPKPMIEIGGKPILWHIMKIYSFYGFKEFIICCGYKGYLIKEYFANYSLHMSDVTLDIENNNVQIHQKKQDMLVKSQKMTALIDTGDLKTDMPVSVTGPQIELISEGMVSEKRGEIILFTGQTRARLKQK